MAEQPPFNIVIVAQNGRLQYEAILFAASLRHASPGFTGRLFVATPRPGPLWKKDPSLRSQQVLSVLERLGAEILPFDSQLFGKTMPMATRSRPCRHCPRASHSCFSTATR